jgi:hypothetical protein
MTLSTVVASMVLHAFKKNNFYSVGTFDRCNR